MILILADNTVCEVTTMYDVDGDKTEDPDGAFCVVAKHPDGLWIVQEVGPEMRIKYNG